MRLERVDVASTPDGIAVTGTMLRAHGEPFRTTMAFDGVAPPADVAAADAMAAAMLIPAMRLAEPLEIVPPLSPLLAASLPRIRDVFHTWYPALARIDIRCTADATPPTSRPGRAATFFSGGVDSFYTLLKHRHGAGSLGVPLTHVVFLEGVEQNLDDTKGADESRAWVRRVAAEAQVECVTGATNLRSALQRSLGGIHWEKHYHGSALAGLGLALSGLASYVCIPSAFSYNHMVAHGSTPLADEMFSTERVRILHDGAELPRARKVERIVAWNRDLVLANLRVCIRNHGGAYNCGRCYKCVRTAIPLYVLGAWDDARTFPDKSRAHWERVMRGDHLVLVEENLELARACGGHADIVAMLERVVRRKRRREAASEYVHHSVLRRLLPAVRRLRRWRSARA
jgi:hypothetical protein